jgi:hypothetical protein
MGMEEKAARDVTALGLSRGAAAMVDEGEKTLPDDLTLAEIGLRVLVDDNGTSLEFTCSAGTKAVIRVNDIANITRQESETLRHWSADRQARRKL